MTKIAFLRYLEENFWESFVNKESMCNFAPLIAKEYNLTYKYLINYIKDDYCTSKRRRKH